MQEQNQKLKQGSVQSLLKSSKPAEIKSEGYVGFIAFKAHFDQEKRLSSN